jgi:hypothetical protein
MNKLLKRYLNYRHSSNSFANTEHTTKNTNLEQVHLKDSLLDQ